MHFPNMWSVLTDKEAETTREAIFNKWICRYGRPLEIVSDNGKEFRNKLAMDLYKRPNMKTATNHLSNLSNNNIINNRHEQKRH